MKCYLPARSVTTTKP